MKRSEPVTRAHLGETVLATDCGQPPDVSGIFEALKELYMKLIEKSYILENLGEQNIDSVLAVFQ